MKRIAPLIFIIAFEPCVAQETAEAKVSINVLDLIGTWTNSSHSYSFRPDPVNKKVIGKTSTDEKIAIPMASDGKNGFIAITADGKFMDLRNQNATWTFVNGYLVVRLQFGDEYRCLIQKNDSTGICSLSYMGETFIKKSETIKIPDNRPQAPRKF